MTLDFQTVGSRDQNVFLRCGKSQEHGQIGLHCWREKTTLNTLYLIG